MHDLREIFLAQKWLTRSPYYMSGIFVAGICLIQCLAVHNYRIACLSANPDAGRVFLNVFVERSKVTNDQSALELRVWPQTKLPTNGVSLSVAVETGGEFVSAPEFTNIQQIAPTRLFCRVTSRPEEEAILEVRVMGSDVVRIREVPSTNLDTQIDPTEFSDSIKIRAVLLEEPKKEVPKKEVPKKEEPKKEVPKKEVPKKEVPKKEVPKTNPDAKFRLLLVDSTSLGNRSGLVAEIARLAAERKSMLYDFHCAVLRKDGSISPVSDSAPLGGVSAFSSDQWNETLSSIPDGSSKFTTVVVWFSHFPIPDEGRLQAHAVPGNVEFYWVPEEDLRVEDFELARLRKLFNGGASRVYEDVLVRKLIQRFSK